MSVALKVESTPAFDPYDLSDPYAVWRQFRERRPVFLHAPTGYFVVSRHADIKAVFDDWRTFSSENAQAPMRPLCEEGRRIMRRAPPRKSDSLASASASPSQHEAC